MKITVAQTELDAAAKELGFGAAQAFAQFGQADAAGNRVFDFERLAHIMSSYRRRAGTAAILPVINPSTPWQPAKAREIIAARRKVCFGNEDGVGKCDWNMEGICQHPGCKTCPGKQKNSGALLAFTEQPFAACAANKWNFKL